MEQHKFKPDADSMNALFTAMAALVFSVVRQMPPEQQRNFRQDLVSLSRAKNNAGDTTAGTAILDLALAAEMAMRE